MPSSIASNQLSRTSWRTNLEGGTMDKRKAVFRQLIESATFDGEELMLVPNMATLTGTGLRWRPQGDSNPCCRRERAVS